MASAVFADEGYEDQRFESAVPHNFHCAICLNVLKHPMQCVRNEHSFCRPCILRYLKEFQRCPTCMEQLTQETLRPSRVITDLISQLNIKCDNVEKGCPEIMKLEMIEAHVANCGFTAVKCLNEGCEVTIAKKDQLHHENNECNYRKGKCEVCGKNVPYAKRKLHCYVMRTEIAEMRDEISSIKEIAMILSKDLTGHTEYVIGWMNQQVNDLKAQMDDIKLEMKEIKKEIQSTKQEIQTPVHSLSSPFLQNSNIRNVIIAGGVRLKAVEIFSWTTRQWTMLPPMKSECYLASSFVHEDRMFICGGMWEAKWMQILQLGERGALWEYFTPVQPPVEIYQHTSVVYEDSLYIFGGKCGCIIVRDVWKVHLVHPYSSQHVSCVPWPIAFHGTQRFGDKVVIVGGTPTGGSSGSLDQVLVYNITNNHWQILAPLPFSVCRMATVAWNDNIIIIGGNDCNNNVLDTVLCYNVKEEKSQMLPAMKHKRVDCAAVVTGNVIVVMGGENKEEGSLNSVECFNFHNYMWEEFPQMNEKRRGSTAVVKM